MFPLQWFFNEVRKAACPMMMWMVISKTTAAAADALATLRRDREGDVSTTMASSASMTQEHSRPLTLPSGNSTSLQGRQRHDLVQGVASFQLTGHSGAPAAGLSSSTADQTIVDLAELIAAQPSSLLRQTFGLSSASGAPALHSSSSISDRTMRDLAELIAQPSVVDLAELFAQPSSLLQQQTLDLSSVLPYLMSSTMTSAHDVGTNTAAAAAAFPPAAGTAESERPSSSSAITIEELRQILSRNNTAGGQQVSLSGIPTQELRRMLDSTDPSRQGGFGQDK